MKCFTIKNNSIQIFQVFLNPLFHSLLVGFQSPENMVVILIGLDQRASILPLIVHKLPICGIGPFGEGNIESLNFIFCDGFIPINLFDLLLINLDQFLYCVLFLLQ